MQKYLQLIYFKCQVEFKPLIQDLSSGGGVAIIVVSSCVNKFHIESQNSMTFWTPLFHKYLFIFSFK